MISSWCFPLAASASSTALSFSRLVIMMIILMSVIVCSDDDGFMWWLMMMWLVVSIVMMMMTMRIIFNVILTCWPSPGWPPPVSQHIALQMEADYKYIHMKAEQIWQINIENFQDQCSYTWLWLFSGSQPPSLPENQLGFTFCHISLCPVNYKVFFLETINDKK